MRGLHGGSGVLSITDKPGEKMATSSAATTRLRRPTEAVCAIQSRCCMCQPAEPVWAGVAHAPKGVAPRHARGRSPRHAGAIRVQAVLTHAMPPNNLTEMTLDERRAVAAWLAGRDRALR